MGNNPSNHQPLERAHVSKYGDVNSAASKGNGRRSLRSPKKMDRLRRSFRDSFRKRKDRMPESSKPHQWQADEQAVRSGTCTFVVKYLGCVEVFESRGMQVCEEALKVLRASRRRPIRAVLHVSGDGLRVVEDETKGLIVDQTIEKVSFCAPDRNYERGFSYICRDGTTRRWMCHGFLAYRDSGERLSHAVGCAFAACLERKQRRDKECGVTMTFDQTTNTFTRTGSFRTQSITERIENEDAPKTNATVNPFAIERPHATPHMLERQGSFRGLSQLGNNSPFKRQMSLRISELPSNAERLKAYRGPNGVNGNGKAVSPIPELSPGDSVTALCQQLSQGLSQLTHSGSDDFNFNSEASINQNNIGLSSGFGPNMTPNRPGFVAPINLSFNSNLDHSPISNSALGQHNSYSPISSTLGQSQTSLGQSQNSLGQSQTSLGQSQNSLGQISRMRASPSLSQTSSLVHRGPSPNPSLNQLSRMGQSVDHSPGSGLGHRGPSPIGSRLARMGQSIDHGVGQLGHQRVLSTNESIRGARTFGPGNTSPNFGDVDHQGVGAPVQNSLNMGAGVTSIRMGGNVTRLGQLTNSTGDNLPKPEQWLGHIVQSTTPARDAESGVSPGRRGPNVGAHSRTMSLGSAESFGRLPQVDPFDAEWAAIATRTNGDHGGVSTNPFLNPGAPQAFQIQL